MMDVVLVVIPMLPTEKQNIRTESTRERSRRDDQICPESYMESSGPRKAGRLIIKEHKIHTDMGFDAWRCLMHNHCSS
jgi:hypothetical protein